MCEILEADDREIKEGIEGLDGRLEEIKRQKLTLTIHCARCIVPSFDSTDVGGTVKVAHGNTTWIFMETQEPTIILNCRDEEQKD